MRSEIFMTAKARKMRQPWYVGQFRCIGPDCEDSCCIGWQVQIDKDTYRRYRECPDSLLRARLAEKVTRKRGNAGNANYAKIKLNADTSCPFIDAERWCSLQRKLGEEYLSVTCTAYPRLVNVVDGIGERSLTLSCPEAARLALLDPEPMAFGESDDDGRTRYNVEQVIDTGDIRLAHSPQRFFPELRLFIVSLLQNRSYELWQRLVVLGLFCRSVAKLAGEARTQDIPQLIGTYRSQLAQSAFRNDLDQIPDQTTLQMELMKEVAEERVFAGVSSQRFMECFAEFLQGIQYTADAAKEDIGRRYAQAFSDYYAPFVRQNGHILENYLVNYVFKNLFPFSGNKNVFDNYVMLVVHYAMINMLLIGMAGFHRENFNAGHALKLIQSFAKTVEHNKSYLKNVLSLLETNQFNTMPYMAILLKN